MGRLATWLIVCWIICWNSLHVQSQNMGNDDTFQNKSDLSHPTHPLRNRFSLDIYQINVPRYCTWYANNKIKTLDRLKLGRQPISCSHGRAMGFFSQVSLTKLRGHIDSYWLISIECSTSFGHFPSVLSNKRCLHGCGITLVKSNAQMFKE